MAEAIKQSFKNLITAVPIMLGVLMLINLLNPLLKDVYRDIFTGNIILDPLIGAGLGSISFGIPVTSYIAGGELLKGGVSLVAVTAFLLSWTTVGIAMLPLESKYLGTRFAIARNSVNFAFSVIIAILTVLITGLIS